MEYLDLALDYLKTHKLVAAAIAVLFIALLIRNFWFLIKLLVFLVVVGVVVFFAYSFVTDALKQKKDLLKPSPTEPKSSLEVPFKANGIEWPHHVTFSGLLPNSDHSAFKI